jgi:hypothetical protein
VEGSRGMRAKEGIKKGGKKEGDLLYIMMELQGKEEANPKGQMKKIIRKRPAAFLIGLFGFFKLVKKVHFYELEFGCSSITIFCFC